MPQTKEKILHPGWAWSGHKECYVSALVVGVTMGAKESVGAEQPGACRRMWSRLEPWRGIEHKSEYR